MTDNDEWNILKIRSKFASILLENSTNHCKLEDMLPVLEKWKAQIERQARQKVYDFITERNMIFVDTEPLSPKRYKNILQIKVSEKWIEKHFTKKEQTAEEKK